MEYDDDFDEEAIFGRGEGASNKYGLQVIHGKKGKKDRKAAGDSSSANKLSESPKKTGEGGPPSAFDGIS
jgi:hypothetical protein